ncbi:MAG: trigger factor [Chloroflexi bacterium RBG_19FT_COMBO_47_9]|nr:MAG: trigger factor [Chloroflexi bacterium RBG_19FT_COMBO_47_9]
MNIEKQYQEDHQMKLTVQVEPQALEEARQHAARKISKHTKIPGFRPGKAPYSVILRTVGEAAIFEEAVEILATDLYPKAIDEAGIEPYGPGQLENITSTDPLTFEFIVPLDAEITLGDYHSLRLAYKAPVIEDGDVERVLNDLRERQAVLTPVERPAMESDQVSIKLNSKRNNVEEGQNSTLIEERSTTINVKKTDGITESEWPFPGFSQHLIGLTVGDQKTITYTYPEESEWESLRGQEAEFGFTVESVKSRELPAQDDEFARTIGEYETVEALIKDIRSSLEEQALNEYNAEYHQQIVTELLKDATIKYPPQMLEHEIKLYIDQLENRLAQQGLDLATYLKTRQMDDKALNEEVKPLAEQRLKQTLVIFKAARQENITVSNEEIETESSQALAEISKHMTPDQAKKAISEGYIRNLVGNISTDLLIRRTYARLESITKGEYNPEEVVLDTKTEGISE